GPNPASCVQPAGTFCFLVSKFESGVEEDGRRRASRAVAMTDVRKRHLVPSQRRDRRDGLWIWRRGERVEVAVDTANRLTRSRAFCRNFSSSSIFSKQPGLRGVEECVAAQLLDPACRHESPGSVLGPTLGAAVMEWFFARNGRRPVCHVHDL